AGEPGRPPGGKGTGHHRAPDPQEEDRPAPVALQGPRAGHGPPEGAAGRPPAPAGGGRGGQAPLLGPPPQAALGARPRRRAAAGGGAGRPRSSHHWLRIRLTVQPSHAARPAMVWVRCGSLLPKSVDSRGTRTMAAAAPQTRFIMIDVVRAKLRTIHLRCSS